MEVNLEVKDPKETPASIEVVERVATLDKQGRAYATGKRKTSIARVWIKKGKGEIIVNKKPLVEEFPGVTAPVIINQPFVSVDVKGQYDVYCTVTGGGKSGQAEAIRQGIAKALVEFNPEAFHKAMREAGFLTRDSRKVERKKYGHKKARKSFQFSKR